VSTFRGEFHDITASSDTADIEIFDVSGLPDGLTADRIASDTLRISGTVSYWNATPGNPTTHCTVSVTAWDSMGGNADLSFDWNVVNKNLPPDFMSWPQDQTVFEEDSVWLESSAYDSDGQTLAWSATGLPDWLTIDPATGTISGSVPVDPYTGDQLYSIEITVTDGVAPVSKLVQIQEVDFDVNTLVINNVPAGNSWNNPVVLPQDFSDMQFSFTATGVGAGASGHTVFWTVFEADALFDDLLFSEVRATTTAGVGANGAWTLTVTFSLSLTQPNRYVRGGYEDCGEQNPDIIRVLLEGFWGGDYRTSSNGIFVAAQTPS
jgi:hypothetical protein